MSTDARRNAAEVLEQTVSVSKRGEQYVLRLFVSGMSPRSTEAVATIKAICDEHVPGRYDLEVVDIYQFPALARDERIVAMPTLVKKLPAPLRRLIGNLSDRHRVLCGLGLRENT